MARFNPPSAFDFSKPNLWPDWKQRWKRFHSAVKMNKEDGEVQVSSLIYSMGQQAETIFNSFTFTTENDKKDHDKVLKKFDEHFIPSINVIHERANFHLRNQKPNESVEEYIRVLYELGDKCKFSDAVKEEELRDRLVVGITDKECSEKLQLKSNLTLQEAIDLCRTSELVKNQITAQQPSANLDAVNRKSFSSGKSARNQSRPSVTKYTPQPNSRNSRNPSCDRCGYQHQHRKCPAAGQSCKYCKKIGHFAKVCRKAKHRQEIQELEAENEQPPANVFLGAIQKSETTPWTIDLQVTNTVINFKVDSGADVTCIPVSVYNKLKPSPKLETSSILLNTPAGALNVIGKFDTDVAHKTKFYKITIHVIESASVNCLLSRSDAFNMGILKFVAEINEDLFSDYGLMNCDPVRIKLKDDAVPYHLHSPRRVAEPLLKPVKEELDKMVANSIISPITEPTEWCAPMVVALKKNNKVRICVDLKKLNQSVQRERYMMPTIDELAAKLTDSKIFSYRECP